MSRMPVALAPGPLLESFDAENVPICPGYGPGRGSAARERGCRQKMRVCPEACSLFWAALSLACFWYSRWRLEQVWHRVSSGMGGPRIPHRCPGAWPCRFFPGWCPASIPRALESGPAGVRTRGVSPAWLPALLVSALPVASAAWVGAWPSSGWSSSGWPWGFWWLPCGGWWISWALPGGWAPRMGSCRQIYVF